MQSGNNTAFKCADRYYCISGSSVNRPTDGKKGRLCAAGYYCKAGIEQPCNGGYYSTVTGLKTCTVCPMGYYCQNQNNLPVKRPTPCTNTNYCPAGSTTPTACPAGTYLPLGIDGLESAS
jgi:hypothetical protein